MNTLRRNDIDHLCYLIAKEYKKQNRAYPECEMIIVGGASVLLNYNFRDETTDIDSLTRAYSNIKDVINKVGDENGLPIGWFNDDFKKTDSFSPKLVHHSQFYKKFCNCLSVYTVTDEYLLAMKLRSCRDYKHDISDIVGILKEEQERGSVIGIQDIEKAYIELYDTPIPEQERELLAQIMSHEDLEELFYETQKIEEINRDNLTKFEARYPNVLSDANIHRITQNLQTEQMEGKGIFDVTDEDRARWAKEDAQKEKSRSAPQEQTKGNSPYR